MNKAAVAGKVSQRLRLIFTCGLLAVVALALAPAMVANAADIQVTNNNDSGAGSLRLAIADVGIGEEITFADNVTGTITLTTGQLSISKNLTITGPGADILTISGNNASRVFNIGSGVTVTISGLTIANGYAAISGAGINNNGGTLTINNCTITNNDANDWGGGIRNEGTLTLNNSTVSDNTARIRAVLSLTVLLFRVSVPSFLMPPPQSLASLLVMVQLLMVSVPPLLLMPAPLMAA